jgi:hypothetical protein
VLPVTQSFLDALPALDCTQPLPPTLPDFLKVATLTLFRNARAAFEVIEHPETIGPWCDHNVNQAEFFAEEEGALGIHLTSKFLQMVEEFGLFVFQAIFTLVL